MMWKSFLILSMAICVLGMYQQRVKRDKVDPDYGILLRYVVTAMCKEHRLDEHLPEVEQSIDEFSLSIKQFVDSLANYDQEIKEAKRSKENGTLDKVIKEQCQKIPPLKAVFYKVLDGIKPCLVPEEQEYFTGYANIYARYMDFICLNEGAWLTRLYNANADECLDDNKAEIRTCTSKYNESFMKITGQLSINQEQCVITNDYLTCVIQAIQDKTPDVANILREMQSAWKCE